MQTPTPTPSSRPSKSRGRLAIDVVLFAALAAVVGWSGLHRVGEGIVTLRLGPEVVLAVQPGLFWALVALHVLAILICLALSGFAARALARSFVDGTRR